MKIDDLKDEPASGMANLDHSSLDQHDHQQSIRTACPPASSSQQTSSSLTRKGGPGKKKGPSRSSGIRLFFMQVRAVVTKIMLSKFRTPFSTCMEVFTPLAMMLILVSAYTLSEVTYKEAETYDTISFDLPGPWADIASELIRLRNDQLNLTSLTDRRLFDESVPKSREIHESLRGKPQRVVVDADIPFIQPERLGSIRSRDLPWMEDASSLRGWGLWTLPLKYVRKRRSVQHSKGKEPSEVPKKEKSLRRRLQDFEAQDNDLAESDDFDDIPGGDLYDLVDSAYSQIRKLLKNPMLVPSFDEYVGLSVALGSLVDVDALPRLFTDSSYGRQWGNLLTLGTIHLSPSSSNATKSFHQYLNDTYPLLMEQDLVKIQTHDSEQNALNYIDDSYNTEQTWALVDLSGFPENSADFVEDDIRFKIRMNYTTLPNTNEITNFVSIGLNTDYQRYYFSGYLTLQRTLNEFAMSYFTPNETMCASNMTSSIWSMPMPTAAYSQNSFYLAVGYLLGLTIVMAYLFPTSRLIKSIVEEKETKLKETMFIMGLQGWAHWVAWITCSLAVFGLIAILVTGILTSNIMTYSSEVYLFWWIFFFSTATVGFSFTIASLFSKAKLAAIIGPMALFATLLPRFIFFGDNRYEAAGAKKLASLLPATAFSFGADIVADYEYSEQGVQSWNADEGDYSFNTSVGFLFFDTILYIFLGWYLDQIVPREYGAARPFWFLISPSYWCPWLKKCFGTKQGESTLEGSHTLSNGNSLNNEDHQSVDDPSLVPGVVIENLFKVYKKSTKGTPAVDHLSLVLYQSQITTLLGHNGAGKSSTINMLTGLFRPTSGDVTIFGESIVSNTNSARRSIGICPQQNVLFDLLTVREHIVFFLRIKGVRPSLAQVDEMIDEIGLDEFYNVASSALSGGNKRKLCVASALCGDPDLIIADEPTAGVDPAARRRIWNVLRKRRHGRCILLCTHFMDEAKLLSDRIAIMKAGKSRCSGTPLFLQQRFGVGYNVLAVFESPEISNSKEQMQLAANNLLDLCTKYLDGCMVQRIGGKEVTIRLPTEQEDGLVLFLKELENKKEEMGIGAFGVENASLEEIFINLADSEESHSGQETKTFTNPKISKGAAFTSQIALLYWKRFAVQRRDIKGLFFAVVVPVLLIALVLLILRIEVPLAGSPVDLSPNLYKYSNAGDSAMTDVLIGGGIAANKAQVDSIFSRLREWSLGEYGELVNIERRQDRNSSQSLSELLLETINERDHNERFGAFALHDSIPMNVKIDWPLLERGIEDYLELLNETTTESLVWDGPFNINVNSLLEELERANLTLSINLSTNDTDELLDTVFEGTNFTRERFEEEVDRTLNTTSLGQNVSAGDLTDIFQALNATNFVFQGGEASLSSSVVTLAVWALLQVDASLEEQGDTNFEVSSQDIFDFFAANGQNSSISISGESVVLDWAEQRLSLRNVSISVDDNDFLLASDSFNVSFSGQNWQGLFPEYQMNYSTSIQNTQSVLHNSSSPHAIAAFNQHFAEYLFKNCTKLYATRLISENHPLPLTTQQSLEIKTVLSILASMFILIPYCLIPGAFIVFLVQEKASKAKHLQLVSGTDVCAYWLSAYFFDVTRYLILTVLVMVIFLSYGSDSAQVFVGSAEAFWCTSLLTFGYGLSVMPFSYLLARRFSNHSSAQIAVIGLIFITGFVAVNAYFIMDSIERTKDIAETLRPVFRLWPAYSVGDGLIMMASAFWEREILLQDVSPFDWDVAGRPLALLYGLSIPYFLLLLAFEYAEGGGAGRLGRCMRRLSDFFSNGVLFGLGFRERGDDGSLYLEDGLSTDNKDSDVLEEELFVRSNFDELKKEAPVVFLDLWKVYLPSTGLLASLVDSIKGSVRWICRCCCFRGSQLNSQANRTTKPKRAVRGLCTAVQEGEIFALLGSNGAGKTTTLGMLSGDVTPTSGQLYVAGHDVSGRHELDGLAHARKHIGFCPQVDPLIDNMSVRETFQLYGRLRGISKSDIEDVVEEMISFLLLKPHAEKTCDSLSGGNKRKTSLGIALIGSPKVLLIDESSSGLDPLAKRQMWNLISSVSRDKTVLCTTHSMEEAEALCSRAGIMSNGQLLCLGSVQHLKSKYLDGYTIDLFCSMMSSESQVDDLVRAILERALPGSTLDERHGRFLRFEVSHASEMGIGTMFANLETIKREEANVLESYSISQCTLEQVFVQLSNRQSAKSKGPEQDITQALTVERDVSDQSNAMKTQTIEIDL